MFQLSGDVMRPDNNTPPSRDAFWEYLELYRTFKYFSTATGTRVFHARFFNLRTIGNTRNRRGRGISSLPWLSILDSNSFLCSSFENWSSMETAFLPISSLESLPCLFARRYAFMSPSFDLLYCAFGLWKIGSQARWIKINSEFLVEYGRIREMTGEILDLRMEKWNFDRSSIKDNEESIIVIAKLQKIRKI